MLAKIPSFVKIILIVVLVAIVAGGYSMGYYYHNKYADLVKDPNAAAQQKALEIINNVQKLIVVPQNETPNISIVTNKDSLVNQPFFKNVENGDILLVYASAMQAILYRATTNKIVAVIPLTTESQAAPLENQQQPVLQKATTTTSVKTPVKK
ncbi:MAG: hypothetical protein PHG25_00425 [Candidatus Pacebacteria bacterium]|nr:hypothetical protein [Candidatus Paceibacterota bacterium]